MSKKQYKPKRKPSIEMAKHLLQESGEEKALSLCRNEIKKVRSVVDEVYWRAVMYHVKQLTKNK